MQTSPSFPFRSNLFEKLGGRFCTPKKLPLSLKYGIPDFQHKDAEPPPKHWHWQMISHDHTSTQKKLLNTTSALSINNKHRLLSPKKTLVGILHSYVSKMPLADYSDDEEEVGSRNTYTVLGIPMGAKPVNVPPYVPLYLIPTLPTPSSTYCNEHEKGRMFVLESNCRSLQGGAEPEREL